MKYIEIDIETTAAGIEAVVGELMAMGITDTVVEDPRDIEELMDKKQTYDWDYLDDSIVEKMKDNPKVKIYLEDTTENRKLAARIAPAMISLKKAAKTGAFGENSDFGSLHYQQHRRR